MRDLALDAVPARAGGVSNIRVRSCAVLAAQKDKTRGCESTFFAALRLRGGVNKFPRALRAEAPEHPKLLPLRRVIRNEEVLDLVDDLRIQIVEQVQMAMGARSRRDGNQPIVARRLAFLCLLRLDHAENPGRDERAGKCRLIHQHQHVKRIAITAARVGMNPKS